MKDWAEVDEPNLLTGWRMSEMTKQRGHLYMTHSILDIHVIQHKVCWEDMTRADIVKWKSVPNVSKDAKPHQKQGSPQSRGRCSICSRSFSRSKKVDWGFTVSASAVCSQDHLPALYMSVCVCLCACMCVHTCKHFWTFTCTYMWSLPSKALLKSCRGICGFCLPCVPHFGEFPWVTPLLY